MEDYKRLQQQMNDQTFLLMLSLIHVTWVASHFDKESFR